MLAYGKNVLYMTKPSSIKKVYISKTKQDKELFEYLKQNKIHYLVVEKELLNRMTKENHQGIVLEIEDFHYSELEEIIDGSFLLMLDHLEDPHNLGAIIRSAEAAGVTGIILPKNRSVSVTDTVIKTSAGAINNIKIVKVTNLVDTIKKLQKENFFIYGADMEGCDLKEASFADKKVLVIGNEGKGISPIIEKNCDEIISIPMKGKVNSLNASVAAAILIFKMGGLS